MPHTLRLENPARSPLIVAWSNSKGLLLRVGVNGTDIRSNAASVIKLAAARCGR